MTRRRQWLQRTLGGGLAALLVSSPRRARAKISTKERRLNNRLELWATFAARTRTLRARYTLTRTTSLLRDQLVVGGTLVFVGPHTLVLHDDLKTGSTTRILDERISIQPNDPALPGRALSSRDAEHGHALAWMQARLLGLFAGAIEAPARPAFARGCRLEVPRGQWMQLQILPPANEAVARVIQSVRVRLDPTTGAVFLIDCVETRGDRVVIELSDHRQNVDRLLLDEFLADG